MEFIIVALLVYAVFDGSFMLREVVRMAKGYSFKDLPKNVIPFRKFRK